MRRNVVGRDGVTFMGGSTIEDGRGSLLTRRGLIQLCKSKSGNSVSLSGALFGSSRLGVKVKGVRGEGNAKENGERGDVGTVADNGEEDRCRGCVEDRGKLKWATGRGVWRGGRPCSMVALLSGVANSG
jgi:hypothetical protein